ncbi:MAG: single-stranded DNA-binding protein [Spirochaetia bacterium]|nr:single-stranded DNA-binding protein [Spirochaetia bacterium]
MNDTNVVVLKGRLVRGAELKQTNNGTYLTTFAIAVNETIKNAKGEYTNKANYFDCTLWGNFSKSIHQYLTKGREVNITGRLRQDKWTSSDGKVLAKIDIIVKEINLMRTPADKNIPEPEPQEEEIPSF